VKGGIDREQRLSRKIEEKPGGEHSEQTLQSPQHSHKSTPPRKGRFDQLLQARRADDAVVVLRNAFAAVKMAALRTARRGLTQGMIEAALVDQGSHGQGLTSGTFSAGEITGGAETLSWAGAAV
jgi:hypothetical protein